MEREFKEKIGDLQLTKEEITRLSECMKDKKFMELLKDYAMEIRDPENKKKYEEEIAMMEGERGNDVRFIHPTPGHVLKTNCNGEGKCFINICSSPEVGKPVGKPTVNGSVKGMQWSIPHSLSQSRDDMDKAGGKCIVFDVVYSPYTYDMAVKNAKFCKMVHDVALDAVERHFEVKLDKVNVKTPKMKYKGLPQASIIRMPCEDTRQCGTSISGDPKASLNVVVGDESKLQSVPCNKKVKSSLNALEVNNSPGEEYVKPKYSLVHRGYFDMKDFHAMPNKNTSSTRPRELVLNVELPMLKTAAALHLEIFEDRVFLECVGPVKYKLEVKLPYNIDDSKGHARFDKAKRLLTVTLEVVSPMKLLSQAGGLCISCSSNNVGVEQIQGDAAVLEPLKKENYVDDDIFQLSHLGKLIHGQSKCRHQKSGNSWGKPLNEQRNDVEPLIQHSVSLIKVIAKEYLKTGNTKLIKKSRPQIFYHQDDSCIVLIINISYIDSERLWYVINSQNLQFAAMEEVTTPLHIYQLFVTFNGCEKVDPQGSRVDISDDNAVFVLQKHVNSRHEWQNFSAGFDEKSLKKLFFSTQENVNDLMRSVKAETWMNTSREFECEDMSHSRSSEMLILKFIPKEITDEFKFSDGGTESSMNISEFSILKGLFEISSASEKQKYVEKLDKVCVTKFDTCKNPERLNFSSKEVKKIFVDEDPSEYDTVESSSENGVEIAVSFQNGESGYNASKLQNEDNWASHKPGAVKDLSYPVDVETCGIDQSNMKHNLVVCSPRKIVNRVDTENLIFDKPPEHSEIRCQTVTSDVKSAVKLHNEMLFEIDSD